MTHHAELHADLGADASGFRFSESSPDAGHLEEMVAGARLGLGSAYDSLPDEAIGRIIERRLSLLPEAEAISFGRALKQLGRTAQTLAPTVLPIGGAALGTVIGGPVGTAAGGQLGSRAAGAILPPRRRPQRRPTPRRRPAPQRRPVPQRTSLPGPAAPSVRSQPKPARSGGSTASSQAMALTQDPRLAAALTALILGAKHGAPAQRAQHRSVLQLASAVLNRAAEEYDDVDECDLDEYGALDEYGDHHGVVELDEYGFGADVPSSIGRWPVLIADDELDYWAPAW